jgi:(2Fe-2S) ferredoxin
MGHDSSHVRPLRYVWVCTKRREPGHRKGSCAEQGGEELVRALKVAAGKAGVPARVTSSGCFDLCWVGPAVAIMPDNLFLKRVTAADIPEIVAGLRDERLPCPLGPALSAKVAVEQDFEDPTKARERP